jgi:hypothetical protein
MDACTLLGVSTALNTQMARTHLERSLTIQVAPMPWSCSRSWLVQTASTFDPAATPDLTPEGASSTTMPGQVSYV